MGRLFYLIPYLMLALAGAIAWGIYFIVKALFS